MNERWKRLDAMTDSQLREAYIAALDARVSSGDKSAPVGALRERALSVFDKSKRNVRQYFVSMSELVAERRGENR